MPTKTAICLQAFLLMTFSAQYAQGQKISFSNMLRYGTGKEITGESGADKRKEYLDNLADLRIFFDHITIGSRFDFSEPPEYGLPYNGIRKKYIQYENEGLNIRAGDVYTLFSRGLALNLFENRTLGFDNGLEGVKVEYRNALIRAILLGGEVKYTDPATILATSPYDEHYTLRAANLEIAPLKELVFGGSFVWTELRSPRGQPDNYEHSIVQIPEFYLNLKTASIDIYTGYTAKVAEVGGVDSSSGYGIYAALNHTGTSYGLTLEYKNYRFDLTDPFNRLSGHRPTRALPLQNPPIVHKEHSFTLLSRYSHIVDFNDEVGVQLDAFYTPVPEVIVNVDLALSSRHYRYKLTDNDLLQFTRAGNSASFLPGLDEEFSPFSEYYAEVEYDFEAPSSYVKVAVDGRNEISFDEMGEAFGTGSVHPLRSFTIPVLVQLMVSEQWSVKVSAEEQWVVKSKYPADNKFFNQLLSAQFSHSPDLSFGLLYEHTTNPDEVNAEKNWIMGECAYRLNSKHRMTVSYGTERGGQICSNGICRQVYPFNGVRLSILSNI